MSSPPTPNAPLILEAQADFALNLLREVSTDDRSCVVSPFSVAVTLSMVYAGAEQNTGEEIGQLLAKGVGIGVRLQRVREANAFGRHLLLSQSDEMPVKCAKKAGRLWQLHLIDQSMIKK